MTDAERRMREITDLVANDCWLTRLDAKFLLAEVSCLQAEREAERTALRTALQAWAWYAFRNHGNDARLYNGLADLAGVTPDGEGWIKPSSPPPHRRSNL